MLQDFTQAVLCRPQMYTLMGSYTEVIAFLEGYYSGLAKSQVGMTEVTRWSSFRQWLAQKLDTSTPNEVKVLADRYEDRALLVFARFYEEFKTTSH